MATDAVAVPAAMDGTGDDPAGRVAELFDAHHQRLFRLAFALQTLWIFFTSLWLCFADGSGADGFIPMTAQISDESEAFFNNYVASHGFPVTGGGSMSAGDATFHSGWCLHRAPGNVTDRVREVMTVIYYPDGTRVSEPKNDFQKADLKNWLNDIEPGRVADGPLNPVVY